MKTVIEMVTVPVQFTVPEKGMLEDQAEECDTVLPKFIRIRSLMDETDTMSMQQIITEQRDQLENLRVKLSFFQEQPKKTETVKPLTDKSVNGLLIKMNEQQLQFLKEKYLKSYDYEDENSTSLLSDGTVLHNERKVLEYEDKVYPNFIIDGIACDMLIEMIDAIEKRLKKHCGFTDDDFEDGDLYLQFDALDKE
jgi:competence CoiA-like predicted nuclease